MGWRALGVATALAAIGVAAGVAIGYQQRPPVTDIDTARPVPAQSPSIPVDPPVEVVPDPAFPPMPTDLPTVEKIVGGFDFGVVVPVPERWEGKRVGAAQRRWDPPGNLPKGYDLRVEMVATERLSIAEMKSNRMESLEENATEFTLRSQTESGFVYTFVDGAGHLRLQMLRWLQPRASDRAEVEISLIGRVVDEEGMADLMEVIAAGARVPTAP